MSNGINKRIALWDNLKFFTIALVVVGHLLDVFANESQSYRSLYVLIYAFHMPLFIFISGFFYKDSFLREKVLYFYATAFILKMFLSVSRIIFIDGGVMYFSLLGEGGIPWFLFALGTFYFMMYFFRDINKNLLFFFFAVLSCFTGYDKTIGNHLYLSRIIYFFPFFVLGSMHNEITINCIRNNMRTIKIFISTATIVFFSFVSFKYIEYIYDFVYLFKAKSGYADNMLDYGFYARLVCYVISILLIYSFIIVCPDRKIPFITKSGENTINVYFYHWTFYLLLEKTIKISSIFYIGRIGKILYILYGIILTIILSNKMFSFPLKQIKNIIFNNYSKATVNDTIKNENGLY